MLDSTQRATAAELLWAAERDLAPIGPLTETFPGIDGVDAYEIQLANIRRKIAAGPWLLSAQRDVPVIGTELFARLSALARLTELT